MDKTENNDSEQQSKRPSARRHTPEPIEQPQVKRVHARRPLNAAEAAIESRPRAPAPRSPRASARTTVREGGEKARVRAGVRDRDNAAASTESTPARASESEDASAEPEGEASASAQAASEVASATIEDAPTKELAEASHWQPPTKVRRESSETGLEDEPLSVRESDDLATSTDDEPLLPPTAAASVVWHSDAAAPGRDREPIIASHALARHELGDDFGLDDSYETKLRPWLETMCKRYFRVELHGAHNVPRHGRALLVSNHSRSLIWDGIILRTALRLHHDVGREMRWLVDDAQFHAPFLGTFINRLGAVRACQENAERLLLREELVAVFPEGAKAAEKRYEDRFRLQRFGRGGYVKLALRTGAPVLPVAIVAAVDDDRAWLNRLGSASRLLGAPLFALRPNLPRLGQLGVPPIASHFRITIGEPIGEISRQDADATSDDGLVHELNEFVRGAVQNLVDQTLRA